MATPLTAGASAVIIEHLLKQRNMSSPSSALVKGLLAGLGVDMDGQYGGQNGAAEVAPNHHEGWGRVNLQGLMNATILDREQISTGESHPYRFALTGNVSDLRVMASWTDPASSPAVAYNLVNRIVEPCECSGAGLWGSGVANVVLLLLLRTLCVERD